MCLFFCSGFHVAGESKKPDITLNESMIMKQWECNNTHENRYWSFTEEETEALARLMMSEAEGEGDQGKLLVLLTVLNRVKSPDFPNTVSDVIFQKINGVYQYSPLNDGRFWEVRTDSICYDLIADVQSGLYDDAEGALYFCELSHDKWHKTKEYLFTYNHHKFYK